VTEVLVVPHKPHAHQVAEGSLSWWVHESEDQQLAFVLFECPNGHVGTLRHLHSGNGHHINDRGSVQPSVVCPHEGCGFHEFVRLEDWIPR
jgi:hypothetical protein